MEVDQIIGLLNNQNSYKELRPLKQAIYQEDSNAMNNCFQAILLVLQGKSQEPMKKLLGVRLLKDCYDFKNTDFIRMTVPLIPHLREIAEFKKHIQKEDRGRFYFSENPDKEQAQCGLTLHRLVLECMRAWSIYYPQFYKQTYDSLIKQGVMMPTGYQYFKEESLKEGSKNNPKIHPYQSDLVQSSDHGPIQQQNDLKRLLMKVKTCCIQQEEPESLKSVMGQMEKQDNLVKADLQFLLDMKNEDEFEKLYDDNEKREMVLRHYSDLERRLITWDEFRKAIKGPEIMPVSHQFNSASKVLPNQSQVQLKQEKELQQREEESQSKIQQLKQLNEELEGRVKSLEQKHALDEQTIRKLNHENQEFISKLKENKTKEDEIKEHYRRQLKQQEDESSRVQATLQEQLEGMEELQLKLQAKSNECDQLAQQLQITIESNQNEKLTLSRFQERQEEIEKEYEKELTKKLKEVQQKHSMELEQQRQRDEAKYQSEYSKQLKQVKEEHGRKMKQELENQRVELESHYTKRMKAMEAAFESKLDAQKQLHEMLESKKHEPVQAIKFLPLNSSVEEQVQSISSELLEELQQLRQKCQVLGKQKNEQELELHRLQDELMLLSINEEKVVERAAEESNFGEVVAKQLEINQLNEDKEQLREEVHKLYDENSALSKENQDLRDQLHEAEMQLLKSQPLKEVSNDSKSFNFYQLELRMQEYHAFEHVAPYVDHSDMIFPYSTPADYYANKIKQLPKGHYYELADNCDFNFASLRLMAFGQDQILKDQATDMALLPRPGQLLVVFKNTAIKGIKCNHESTIVRDHDQLRIEIKTPRNSLSLDYVKLAYDSSHLKLPLTVFQQAKFVKLTVAEFKQKWRKATIIRTNAQKLRIKWEHILKLWTNNLILNEYKISEYQYGIDELKLGGGIMLKGALYLMKLELIPENKYILQVSGQSEEVCHELLEQFHQIIKQ